MSCTKVKEFFTLLICFSSICLGGHATFPYTAFQVHIHNELDNATPLILHCKSKDKDVGEHSVFLHNEFNFKFHMDFWGFTLYSCNFWWRGQTGGVKIFDEDIANMFCQGRLFTLNHCYWYVTQKGFFIKRVKFGEYLGTYQLGTWK